MANHNMVFTTQVHAGYDVVTNSGYLLETFTLMQQSGGTLIGTLRGQGFSLVPYDGDVLGEICATLYCDHQQVVVTADGGLHYKDINGWHDCLIAPGA